MEQKKVIYDGDPGHDDAMAILLAEGHPAIDLVGITTVAGNTTLENATKNALMLKDLMHSDVPVSAGCDRPLVKPLYTAPFVHGESGLDGAPLFEPVSKTTGIHACDFIIDTVMNSDDDIYLVAAGPLTNIATALRREPRIESKIKQLVMMGGGRFGNITPAAEFNIWEDAEAAKIVFDSAVPKVLCGLDLTYQATADPEIMDRIRKIPTKLAGFVADFLDFYNGMSSRRSNSKKGAAVNDACCTAYLINPAVFTAAMRRVDIETKGEFTYGMTCIDVYRMNSGKELLPPNVLVGETLDYDLFWEMMVDAIASFR